MPTLIQLAQRPSLKAKSPHSEPRNDLASPGPFLLAAAGLTALGARYALQLARSPRLPREQEKRAATAPESTAPTVRAARRLNRASGVLAFSVLADSALEHYRGSFHNPAMYVPLVVSGVALLTSAHGAAGERETTQRMRAIVYGAAALTGLIGNGFHVYNVTKRPGGFSWENLFYGAPLLAPSAILLSGLVGFMAERIRGIKAGQQVRFLGLPAGRLTAAITAAGLAGTAIEAALLHFRGAFHDRFMFLPVTIAPAAAAVMGVVAIRPRGRSWRFSRWWMRLTALMGLAGTGFHVYGVHRNMGGWRNWRQNVLSGPPLPAPASFIGLALAGLAALDLREEQPHA